MSLTFLMDVAPQNRIQRSTTCLQTRCPHPGRQGGVGLRFVRLQGSCCIRLTNFLEGLRMRLHRVDFNENGFLNFEQQDVARRGAQRCSKFAFYLGCKSDRYCISSWIPRCDYLRYANIKAYIGLTRIRSVNGPICDSSSLYSRSTAKPPRTYLYYEQVKSRKTQTCASGIKTSLAAGQKCW